jgi:hypothetical protein
MWRVCFTIGIDELALLVDGVLQCLQRVSKDGGWCLFDSVSVHDEYLLNEWEHTECVMDV